MDAVDGIDTLGDKEMLVYRERDAGDDLVICRGEMLGNIVGERMLVTVLTRIEMKRCWVRSKNGTLNISEYIIRKMLKMI